MSREFLLHDVINNFLNNFKLDYVYMQYDHLHLPQLTVVTNEMDIYNYIFKMYCCGYCILKYKLTRFELGQGELKQLFCKKVEWRPS